jgi:DNA invertase Pin-like site-specific DNA recombinase
MNLTYDIPLGHPAPQTTHPSPVSQVSIIPATKLPVSKGGQLKEQEDVRIAAYCRVSTGDEDQQTSYSNQKAFYTRLIQAHPNWKFAGIYADEAISGTSRKRRKEFNRMIDDAMDGKLDYIITKSISRFARNTVDTLNCVRQLKQQNPPVGIFFEKENIDTLDATGELILTILSALAQDESRSISDNIRWTFQKNFQAGIPQINLNRMLGYDKGTKGEWIIHPEQAKIIRFLFDRYAAGHSASAVAREANQNGMRTINGKAWTAGAVLDILRNEKFAGDLEMQKTVTKDFLTHRSVRNTGEAPKYYIKDHHAAIIDRFTWDKVQLMLADRRMPSEPKPDKPKKAALSGSPFFNLICGAQADGHECQSSLFRMTYSASATGYTDRRSLAATGMDLSAYREKYSYAFPVWRCSSKYHQKSAAHCTSPSVIQECALEQSFMEMLYQLKLDYELNKDTSWLIRKFRHICGHSDMRHSANYYSTRRKDVLDAQIRELEENLRSLTVKPTANGQVPLAGELQLRLDVCRQEKEILLATQEENFIQKRNFDFFLQCLQKLPETNAAGMKLNIHGLAPCDKQSDNTNNAVESGSSVRILSAGKTSECQDDLAAAPDYLTFERGIYLAFIRSGKIYGDTAEYTTNFGLTLICTGNCRTLNSFLGFRRCREDGTVELLDTAWKVNGKKIQYSRKAKKAEKSKQHSLPDK